MRKEDGNKERRNNENNNKYGIFKTIIKKDANKEGWGERRV